MRLSLVTPPPAEPLTRGEAKVHLRLDSTADDTLVDALIAAAREHVEAVTQRQLVTATWKLSLDRFPRWRAPITLPFPPLQTVSSVAYLDTNGAPQTWASNQYVVDAPAGPLGLDGRIYPAFNVDYPATACREDAVTVQYVAGYGTAEAEATPVGIKQAMLLLIGHWYENREAVNIGNITTPLDFSVTALLAPFCRWSTGVV